MTDVDTKLTILAFSGGPAALIEAGMTTEQVKSFISRPDVQAYIAVLTDELSAHEALQARTKFLAKRSLARLAPQAVQLLADSMRGVVYETNPDGTVKTEKTVKGKGRTAKTVETPKIKHLPPASYQVDAARDVLDRIGVNEKASSDQAGSVSVSVLFGNIQKEGVELDYGPNQLSEQGKILARERVRVVIEKLFGKVPGAMKQYKGLLEAGGHTAKPVESKVVQPAPPATVNGAKAAVKKAKGKKHVGPKPE